ncbi:hypothetical protein [Actinomadura rubteroloni]|nr:hypothetical protein [Actinomadura rubteroloni]
MPAVTETEPGVAMGACRTTKDGRWRPTRLAGGVLGAVAGRFAARALRPLARRAAPRLGVRATVAIGLVEVVAPLALSIAAARMVRRRAPR